MKKLASVSLLSGLLTASRMVSGFLIAKVIAIYAGASGLAALGQIQSLVTMFYGIAAAPGGTALVRYTAQYHGSDPSKCLPWWRAILRWTLVILLPSIPILWIVSTRLSMSVFGNVQFASLLKIIAVTLPLAALNVLILSVLNGQQQYRLLFSLGFVTVFVTTAASVFLVFEFGLEGAAIAVVLNTVFSCFVMVAGVARQQWFRMENWFGTFDKAEFKAVGGYVTMSIVGAICTPLALLSVRKSLAYKVGWEQAGHWQAVWKISEVYLGVITTALNTYFLPKLSALISSKEIQSEIQDTAKVVMPTVAAFAIMVYLARDIAIRLMFTKEFVPARDLFGVQLLGDVVKIYAYLYAYPMLSRGSVGWFISTEIAFSASLAILTFLFVGRLGVQGANVAYLANYSVYFVVVYIYVTRFLRN